MTGEVRRTPAAQVAAGELTTYVVGGEGQPAGQQVRAVGRHGLAMCLRRVLGDGVGVAPPTGPGDDDRSGRLAPPGRAPELDPSRTRHRCAPGLTQVDD